MQFRITQRHSNEKLSNKSEHSTDTLTFLKSNYKYKRRGELPRDDSATEMQRKGNCGKCAAAAAASATAITNSSSSTKSEQKSSKSGRLTVSVILSLFIAIIARGWQRGKLATRRLQRLSLLLLLAVDDDVDDVGDVDDGRLCAAAADDDVNIDSDEINHQRNYDKVSAARCESASPRSPHSPRTPRTPLRRPPLMMMSRCRCDRRRLCRRRRSPVLLRRRRHLQWPSSSTILMTLFIAMALSVRNVQGGACWQSALDSGKCSEIFSLNITKDECCGASQEFSYTDRELTSVEYFFATAIGGGMECAPCIESCKNVKCGANKKCVKRKGRPKCICAPECGAATRRKKHQQQEQQQEKVYRGGHEHHHSEQLRRPIAGLVFDGDDDDDDKSARDIRSLSSEITNVNLGLALGGNTRLLPHQNQNQRKFILLQSQSQQKPPINKREPKPRRLLIANVEQPTGRPTTRRIQILSNVRTRSSSSSRSNSNENVGNANERRRHNKNNNNNNGNSKNDDATRSLESRRGSLMSRHKSNTNNVSSSNELELTKSQTHNKSNNERVRHIHQNARHLKEEEEETKKNAPNHAVVEDKQQQEQQKQHRERHRQFHRKRKHHSNNNNNNNNHRSRQKKLKDHSNANNNSSSSAETAARAATSAAQTTSLTSSVVYNATSEAWYSAINTTATAGTKVMFQTTTTATATKPTTTTPVNSTSSVVAAADRRLLNHGSNSAASSSSSTATATTTTLTSLSSSGKVHLLQTSSSSSSSLLLSLTATATLSASVGGAVAAAERAGGSSNSVNSDDLTFLDGFYEKFNMHGFPSQPHSTVMHFDHMHNAHPVCGTDGRTYNTECQLKKRSCRTDNPNLQVAYRGHCKTTCNGVKCLNGLTCVEDHYTIPHCIVCKIECPQDEANADSADGYGFSRSGATATAAAAAGDVIEPSRAVCGVDGKTYKSTCDINRMICKIGRAIAVAYPGPCRVDRVSCSDIKCGPKHTCLVDLLTHEPRCVSCRYKCSRKRRPASLRLEEGKICGVNNRTYHSWCELRKDSCTTGFFIDVKSAGECLATTE